MTLAGELNTIARTDLSGLKKEFAKGEDYVKAFAERIGGSFVTSGGAMAAFSITVVGLTAALGATAYAAKELFDQLADVTKQSYELNKTFVADARTIGISAAELANWSYAARKAGIDGERFATVFKEIGLRAGEGARDKTGAQYDAFRALGLDFDEFYAMKQIDRLKFIMKTVASMKDQAQKQYFLDDVMGGEGAEFMLPFMDQDPAVIEEWIAKFSELGNLLSNDQRADIEISRLAVSELGVSWTMLGDILAAEVAPYIYMVADALSMLASKDLDIGGTVGADLQMVASWAGNAAWAMKGLTKAWLTFQIVTAQQQAHAKRRFGAGSADPKYHAKMKVEAALLDSYVQVAQKMYDDLENTDVSKETEKFMEESMKRFEEQSKRIREAWEKNSTGDVAAIRMKSADVEAKNLVKTLKEQVELLHTSADVATVKRLEEEGAQGSLLTEIEGLQYVLKMENERVKLLEDQKKAREEASKTAESYMDMIRTDEEKRNAEIMEAMKFFDESGLIGEEDQKAIFDAIVKKYMGTATDEQNPTIGFAGFGSSAAADAVAQHRAGRTVEKTEERAADGIESLLDEFKGYRRDWKRNSSPTESLETFGIA